MSFDTGANNIVKIPVVSHSISGTLILATVGSQFSTPPFRITAITGATYGTTAESLTIFSVTNVATNTPIGGQCTLTVSPIESTADQVYGSSDFAECRITYGTINDLDVAVTALQNAGYQTSNSPITLSGDVTGVGAVTIVTTISAGAIGTSKLNNAAVTYAKAQNVAASSLLGNPSGSPATMSEITLGTNLSFSGSVLNASSGGAGNPGGSANQVQYNSAGTAFAGFTMSGDATLVVATGVITVVSTSGTAFATSATVDTTNASNITSGSLAIARIAPMVARSVVCNSTGSTAAPTAVTISAMLDTFGFAQGDILYRGGSGAWVVLTPGTNGQVLTTGGASANISWAASGTGTVTAVSVATANGFAGTSSGGATPALTLTTSITGILVGNGTAIAAATKISQGADGQLNLAEMAKSGTPLTGDRWNDSTQHCLTGYDGSATSADCVNTYRVGVVYSQITAVTITNTGNNSFINTTGAVGGVAFPAGFLNVAGRTLRIRFGGFGSTGGTPLNQIVSFKLGTTTVATTRTQNLTASKSNSGMSALLDIVVLTTGATGTITAFGQFLCLDSPGSGSGFLTTSGLFCNGTTPGTQTAQTVTTIDLTAALLFDMINNYSAANGVNTSTVNALVIECLA